MEAREIFFALLRIVICNDKADESLQAACTPENLEKVYALAKKHDMAHLVGQAISMLDVPKSEAQAKCKKAAVTAYGRYLRLEHDFQQVCQALEEAQIPFIPLKGSVMRNYYPEPWMRTSCDVDILIKKAQMNIAGKVLTETLGYHQDGNTGHDVSFYSPHGTHIELHFDLVEDGRVNGASRILGQVWENVSLRDGYSFWHEMSDEFFYFYHIAHMAKHFESGGCGIRPVVDLWLLDNVVEENHLRRDELLQVGSLLQFATTVRKLSQVWLCGETADPVSVKLQNFLIHGGVYGSITNRVALQTNEKKSRLRYLWSRVFAPYEKLAAYYPILKKHHWLMPIMQVRRWLMLLRPDVLKMAKDELAISRDMEAGTKDGQSALLELLGIAPSSW